MSTNTTFHNASTLINPSDRVELGLGMLQQLDRLKDSELRVLIFTATYFVLDGVTLTIRRLEGQLKSKGAAVKIVSTVPPGKSASELQNVIVVPGIKIPFNHAGDYSFGVGLDEDTLGEIEKFKPNVVHFTVPDFVALDGIKWCQRNNIAYIGTWHSNYVDYLKYYFLEWILGKGLNRYLRGFFEQIPTVYAPTTYMLKKMREEWGYGMANELKEWGRGVDMQLFSPKRRSQAFRHSKGITDNHIVVLWVSRIVPEKRPDIWFNVIKRLQDEDNLPIKPLVVGVGTYERQFLSLKDVTCCQFLSGTDLAEAYASADVLLFPSDVETFGNVTLEGLSSGLPCIVERKCGDHLVEDGINGITCTAGDTEAFYQAAKKIVSDEVLRKEMSAAARKSAAKYDRNIILQQMLENYKDAIISFKDPMFMKNHLQSNEGSGRNVLSILCCNYIPIKFLAEPFLNTVGQSQQAIEKGVDCVQTTRLSCTDFLSSANLAGLSGNNSSLNNLNTLSDMESGTREKKYDDQVAVTSTGARIRTALASFFSYLVAFLQKFACCLSPVNTLLGGKTINAIGLIFAIGIAVLFIYASFAV